MPILVQKYEQPIIALDNLDAVEMFLYVSPVFSQTESDRILAYRDGEYIVVDNTEENQEIKVQTSTVTGALTDWFVTEQLDAIVEEALSKLNEIAY